MQAKPLLKAAGAALVLALYALFLKATWSITDLRFSLKNVAVLAPLLFISSQFLGYFGNHMWTYFKYN